MENKELNKELKEIKEQETQIQLLPTKDEVSSLEMIAQKLHQSGLFTHLKNPYQALAVVEYGRELGIPPMAALQSMAVINGKICVESKLMLAQFQKQGGVIEVLKRTKEACKIRFIFGKNIQEVEFTIEDAKRIGLDKKDNWVKYPEEMLFWRCIAKGVRSTAPGVMLGAYTIEEMTEGEATTVEELKQNQQNQPQENTIIEYKEQPQEEPKTQEIQEQPKKEPQPQNTEYKDRTINVKQRNLIYIRASEAGVSDKEIHEIIKKEFNKDSVRSLNNKEMDELLNIIRVYKEIRQNLIEKFKEKAKNIDKDQLLEKLKKYNKRIKDIDKAPYQLTTDQLDKILTELEGGQK